MKFLIKGCTGIAFLLLPISGQAQCGAPVALGGAFNALTIADNNVNCVAADKNLNTALFIHRHNSNVFGGNSGNLRYDLSANGGTSWNINQGVLNPVSSQVARYPNAAIYNPPGNTNPAVAYLTYLAATTGGSGWNGVVSGVRQLSGSGNTENYNQPNTSSYLLPTSVVKGAPGVFWGLNKSSNGTYPTGTIYIYKGTWNGVNNVNWTTNTTLNPPFTLFNSYPVISGFKIAFDPTGTMGWMVLMTHISTSPSAAGYYPVFYRTTNSGQSWTGPISVNLQQLNCIAGSISSGSVASSPGEAALCVDVLGNPHLMTIVGHCNNNFDINYNAWCRMFDITLVNNQWTAMEIAQVLGSKAGFNGSNGSAYNQSSTPQISRSADGNKIFFSWADNSGYFQGSANYSPNLFSRGYDIQQNKWTPVVDFSSCNPQTNGEILFMHLSEEVLEPSPNQYKLAPVYLVFPTPSTDIDTPVDFKFLDNCSFSSSSFTISPSTLNLSIAQGTSALLCAGGSIPLQLVGSYPQVIWSTGSTSHLISVNAPGTYTVNASTGCLSGSTSITVNTLTMSINGSNVYCSTVPNVLTATGNAPSYTWMPGSVSGQSFTVPSQGVYTLQAFGTSNCLSTTTISVQQGSATAIIAAAVKSSICAGDEVAIIASGGNTYTWSTGANTSSIAVSPSVNTVYSVMGTGSGACPGFQAVSVQVTACTGLNDEKIGELLTVYPNPSAGSIAIETRSDSSISIFNSLGQCVRVIEAKGETRQFVDGLAPGMYDVKSRTSGATGQVRLIVN